MASTSTSTSVLTTAPPVIATSHTDPATLVVSTPSVATTTATTATGSSNPAGVTGSVVVSASTVSHDPGAASTTTTASGPEIYSEGHQLQLRLNVAIQMFSLMGQDFVILLLEKKYREPWNEGKLWVKWFVENEGHMQRYNFIRNQSKKEIEGKQVVVFADMDVTIIVHVLKTLGTEQQRSMFNDARVLRNSTAHGTATTITKKQFEDAFATIFHIIDRLFTVEKPLVDKWKELCTRIMTGEIQGPHTQLKKVVEELQTVHEHLENSQESQEKMQENQEKMQENLEKMHENLEKMQENEENLFTRVEDICSVNHKNMIEKFEDLAQRLGLVLEHRSTITTNQSVLMKRLQETLQSHIKRDLSKIPIPASSEFIDLNEAVICQSMHRCLYIADKDDGCTDKTVEPTDSEETVIDDAVEKGATANIQTPKPDQPLGQVDPKPDHESDSDSDSPIESASDSSSTHSLELDDYIKVPFKHMQDVIERQMNLMQKRFLVTASGGSGKTTAAKKLLFHWAILEFLLEYFFVVRLDMKQLDYDLDLFDNTLQQYPVLKGRFSATEISEIKECLRIHQSGIFWMLDGIDESHSHYHAEKFIQESLHFYADSVFMMLTRPEGKSILGTAITQAAEFSINDFDPDQCFEFVKQFPFTGNRASAKRESLLAALEKNPSLMTVFRKPINAVMICRLFDEDTFAGDVSNELEIVQALFAITMKAAEIKTLDMKLEKPAITQEVKDELTDKRQTVIEKNIADVMKEGRHLLVKLGKAIFVCNDNSLVGFQNLDKNDLKKELEKSGLSKEEIKFVMRLDILEHKTVDLKQIIQFFHRNFREFTVGCFGSDASTVLPLLEKDGRLKDTHLSIFRCILAQCLTREDESDLSERIVNLVSHILYGCTKSNEWGIIQIITELVQFGSNVGKESFHLSQVLREVVKVIKARNLPLRKNVEKVLKSDFIEIHSFSEKRCEKCETPTKARSKAKSLMQSNESEEKPVYNWPDNKPFILAPFLVKTEEFIHICVPSGFLGRHITTESKAIPYKKPKEIKGRRLQEAEHRIKIVAVGDGAVGKTFLFKAFALNQDHWEGVRRPTANIESYSATITIGGKLYNLELFDTAGLEDNDRLRPLAYPGTDVFLLCFAIVSPASFEDIVQKWLPEVQHHNPRTPFILVGNQADLRTDEKELARLAKNRQSPISKEDATKLAKRIKAKKYVECSAATREGVVNVFEEAVNVYEETVKAAKKKK